MLKEKVWKNLPKLWNYDNSEVYSFRCHRGGDKNDGRTFNQCAFPLVMDAVMAVQAKKNPKDGFWKLEETVAGTVWIFPNEFGSITIVKPEEY